MMDQPTLIDLLTTEETQELEYHEAIVERGLNASDEARQSLRTIQEKRLYRAQYRNFEQYCLSRWGFTRQHAYRLLSADKTKKILSPIGYKDSVDLPEGAIRPLTRLEPDQQREAWEEAKRTSPNGKITGAHVERVVKARVYDRTEQGNGIVRCTACNQLYDGSEIEYCPYCAYTLEERIQYLRTKEKQSPPEKIVHFSSETPEWYTPQHIIDRVLKVMGEIDIDPCSNDKDSPNVPAAQYYTQEDDGLSFEWRGRIYMNPPYGREISDWVNHLVKEWDAGRTTEAIALAPARTDTVWFRWLRRFPRCFVWGRLKFSESENSAPFPSMVVYLGQNLRGFIEAFGDIGDIYQVVEYGIRGE